MVVCRPVLLASIKNTNNGRTMHRSSSIPRYSVVVKGKDIPGLTTPYTNEDCRHRGEWVWSTGPPVSLRSSRKTLRRRHFIYRTTAASVGAAWLCVLVAATDAGCLLILPLFIRRAARLHLSIRQLPPRRDYRRSCCCCWDRFQRR